MVLGLLLGLYPQPFIKLIQTTKLPRASYSLAIQASRLCANPSVSGCRQTVQIT